MRRFITQEYHKMEVQPRVPQTLTTAVSWRPEGIEYKKNEVFLDVIESVNMLVRNHTSNKRITTSYQEQ